MPRIGRTIKVKAAKADAEKVGYELDQFLDITRYCRTLSGEIGGREYQSVSFTIGGSPYTIADPEGYRQEKERFLATIPDVITDQAAFRAEVKALFNKYVFVKDERRTAAEEAVRTQESHDLRKKLDDDRDSRTTAWLKQHGYPTDTVAIPEGKMAVYLKHTYDASDSMSDYYQPHAQIGVDLLLAIVPKQSQTERLCRKILQLFPELDHHQWQWFSERWAWGHGNYLLSEFCSTEHNGSEEVKMRYEICCGRPWNNEKMHVYKKHYDLVR